MGLIPIPNPGGLRVAVTVLQRETWWECPSCGAQSKTVEARPHTQMHPCPGQRGLTVPLVEVASNGGLARGAVRHVAVERGDYVAGEMGVRFDVEGRAVMAVRTERADGSNDCNVFAPTARATST